MYIKYYFVLVSGACYSGYITIYFTKCPHPYFQYLPGATQNYYNVTDSISYAVLKTPNLYRIGLTIQRN